MPAWLYLGFQNPPKSRLGGVLGASLEPLRSVQEAPERGSLILHWFWGIWVGGFYGRVKSAGLGSDPLIEQNQRIKTQNPKDPKSPEYWMLSTPTHAVAPSAVADTRCLVFN